MLPKCTVGLLLHACQLSYRMDSLGHIDPEIENDPKIKLKSCDAIRENGYYQIDGVKPKTEGGQGESGLAAIALAPKDSLEPIVISFRGTKTWSDVKSDISIAKSGLAAQEQLDGAWAFYEKIKKQNPGREIILTGHSLGGHIATYVGIKAHRDENHPCVVAAVRTFNPAPFSKQVAEKIITDAENNPWIENKFINIRLSNDPISSINPESYVGNIFSFRSHVDNFVSAHMLWAMNESLPESIKNTRVTSNPIDIFKENIQGLLNSYECRIKNQFFSSFRLGMKNLLVLQQLMNEINPLISRGAFDLINKNINDSLKKLHGTQSIRMLEELRTLIPEQHQEHKMVEMVEIHSPRKPS